MPAIEPLCQMLKINPKELSKEKLFILEAQLLTMVCAELREHFKSQHKDYFCLIKCTQQMEDVMQMSFISLIVKDLIATGEYTEAGIAYYTQVPYEVINDLIMGRNTSPSILLFEKIISLHRSVRKELYFDIMEKIAEKLFFKQTPLIKNKINDKTKE